MTCHLDGLRLCHQQWGASTKNETEIHRNRWKRMEKGDGLPTDSMEPSDDERPGGYEGMNTE